MSVYFNICQLLMQQSIVQHHVASLFCYSQRVGHVFEVIVRTVIIFLGTDIVLGIGK